MGYKRKTWQEKLADKKGLPKVLTLQENFPCYKGVHAMGAEVGDSIVLTNPSEVVEVMRQVPQGKLLSLVEICRSLARKHQVDACCSLTTGIFVMTVANAVEEAKQQGKTMDVPYWRTVKTGGVLNEKYPGGALGQKKLLEQEGFTIVKKGNKYVVQDFAQYVVEV